MGQRLIINNYTPFIENEITNNIYYHNSAHTDCSIDETSELIIKIKDFYKTYKKRIPNSLNSLDWFNVACWSSVSGINEDFKKSMDYIENLSKIPYQFEEVNRDEGLIAFTKEDIEKNSSNNDGYINIEWSFHNDGTPNFDNTFCNLTNMFRVLTENKLEKLIDKSEIKKLKKNPKTIQIENVSVNKLTKLHTSTPDIWYDKDDEIFYHKILG